MLQILYKDSTYMPMRHSLKCLNLKILKVNNLLLTKYINIIQTFLDSNERTIIIIIIIYYQNVKIDVITNLHNSCKLQKQYLPPKILSFVPTLL